MTKILIMTIQLNLVPNPSETGEGSTVSPDLLFLKVLPLTYHRRRFLATTFDFTSFSPWNFGGHILFP